MILKRPSSDLAGARNPSSGTSYSSSVSRANSTSCLPSWVSRMPVALQTSTGAPTAFSRRWTARVTAGCVSPAASAATVRLPSLARGGCIAVGYPRCQENIWLLRPCAHTVMNPRHAHERGDVSPHPSTVEKPPRQPIPLCLARSPDSWHWRWSRSWTFKEGSCSTAARSARSGAHTQPGM